MPHFHLGFGETEHDLGGGAGSSVPSGTIVMWSMTMGAIPSGWQECDGTGGTPDLRDRFIVARGPSHAADGTGGGAALTHAGTAVTAHTDIINHTHAVNITDSGHTHLTQRYPTATGGSSGFTADTSMSGTPADNTLSVKSGTTGISATTSNPAGGVASLTHSVTQPSDHPAYEPAYYALVYIMKV